MQGKAWVATGSFLAFLAVVAGAFGSHGLSSRLEPEALEVYEVAVRYQLYHSLALILVGILSQQAATKLTAAGWASRQWHRTRHSATPPTSCTC